MTIIRGLLWLVMTFPANRLDDDDDGDEGNASTWNWFYYPINA